MSAADREAQTPENWPGCQSDKVTVYVLCGHRRYKMPNGRRVWMHYTGATSDLSSRLHHHRRGTSGAKLPRAMVQQGIRLRLAAKWVFENANEGWKFEKTLKRSHNAAFHCPYCKEKLQKRNNKRAREKRRTKKANN